MSSQCLSKFRSIGHIELDILISSCVSQLELGILARTIFEQHSISASNVVLQFARLLVAQILLSKSLDISRATEFASLIILVHAPTQR